MRRAGIEVEFSDGVSGPEPIDFVMLEADSADAAEPLLEPARADDSPEFVVWKREHDAVFEARLVAAGASAVLDPSMDAGELRRRLSELVESAAAGGIDGPEGRGLEATPKLADFHSQSTRMREFLDVIARVAETDSTLLITGETGVGKERLARAVHAASPRAPHPFVTVNCGALPESLLESELFGHERGAFTGANERRLGRFETAARGTILLDEIGEMPTQLQVSLLNVLQRREMRRLGSTRPIAVDVRVMAATNRDLQEEVRAGRFREDLFYRLNVVGLEIPPLRERREDVPQLVGRFIRHFVKVHGRGDVRGIDDAAIAVLLAYDWPGNVREAVNVIERAVLLCDGPHIGVLDLPPSVTQPAAPTREACVDAALFELPLTEARRELLEDFERRYLRHHLGATRGAVGETAVRAGINPRTLFEKMRRYALSKSQFR